MNTKPLLVSLSSVKNDPALSPTGRGARKIGVTSLFPKTETPYVGSNWFGSSEKTPVMVLDSTEYAVFTETTVQDRHYHKQGTEFYTVLDGKFEIEVENELFSLFMGDTIVVPAGVVHEVLRRSSFVANVITINCEGISDKYIV